MAPPPRTFTVDPHRYYADPFLLKDERREKEAEEAVEASAFAIIPYFSFTMKFFCPAIFTALAAVSSSLAQSDYGTQLVDALRQNNLTTLADIIQANAEQLVPALQTGNKTVLAPTNEAFAALSDNVPQGDELRSIITYHVLNYTLQQDDIDEGDDGEHTIALTLLSGDPYVLLPNNRSQALVLQEGEGDDQPAQIVQTTSNVSFVSNEDGPRFQNILVQPISQVLSIPGNVSSVATALNATSLAMLLQSTNLLDSLTSAPAMTIFAPTDAVSSAKRGLKILSLIFVMTKTFSSFTGYFVGHGANQLCHT